MMFDTDGPFIRVYRLPVKLTDGYCFGGGVPITFENVDWFGSHSSMTPTDLRRFVEGKAYFKQGGRFLVLSDSRTPDFTFVLSAPKKTGGAA